MDKGDYRQHKIKEDQEHTRYNTILNIFVADCSFSHKIIG